MRILIIEDEEKIINFLKPSLESECFAVDIAQDGEKGLFMAKTNDYDLIILDNMLPKKDGAEVCKQIRLAKKNLPIIMLSVINDTEKKIELLDYGADDYMVKPFSLNELLARIRALLRRPKKIESEVLQIGDLTLDTKKNIVQRNGKEIRLTRKEFMLLEYLMRNEGVVLSRGMIMEHVWDMNADPFSNTIESHVLSLRKKINPDKKSKSRLIHTISGRGYKIENK